jgi:hypothetical protein
MACLVDEYAFVTRQLNAYLLQIVWDLEQKGLIPKGAVRQGMDEVR